jgi:uncharacterized membrane protein
LGFLLAGFGVGLLYRGTLGVNTARRSEVARQVHVAKAVTINRSPQELFYYLRNVENLPRFSRYLHSVQTLDERQSHWVVKGPAGVVIEWDAEVFNEKENELIAWRSLPNSDVTNAGSIHLEAGPEKRGTVLKVVLNYNPPAGRLSVPVAKLLGLEPGQMIEEDLRRLKQLMEAGEIATIEGQPSGRQSENLADRKPATETTAGKLVEPKAASQMA